MEKLTHSAPIDEPSEERLATTHDPSRAEIEVSAYYRYLERGQQDGFDLDDWLAAEADLRADREVITAAA